MDIVEIFKSIGLLAEGTLFLTLAVLVFGLKTRIQGNNLRVLLTEKDNPAISVSFCGFLAGCIVAYTGSVTITGVSFLGHLNDVAKFSFIILFLQVVADIIADKMLFRKFTIIDEIVEKRNVAVALGQAAVSIATGYILAGAFSVPENGIVISLLWFLVGQALLLIVAFLYQEKLTPYNDMEEISGQNMAAGFALSGVIIAVGYTISHAIEGEFTSWFVDLGGVVVYLAVSLALLALMRRFTDIVILPGVSINDEIVKDRNIGAGLIEGSIYILTAMIIAFFLT